MFNTGSGFFPDQKMRCALASLGNRVRHNLHMTVEDYVHRCAFEQTQLFHSLTGGNDVLRLPGIVKEALH